MRGLRVFGLVALVIAAVGCSRQAPSVLLIRGMNVNDYVFDFVLEPQSTIQADSNGVRIHTGKQQIEVLDGVLRVDGRSYGEVKPKDRIIVEDHAVSVNGQSRTAED